MIKRKVFAGVLSIVLLGCSIAGNEMLYKNVEAAETEVVREIPGTIHTEKEINGSFLSVTGFASGKVNARSEYREGDAQYAVVTNEAAFVKALEDAVKEKIQVIEIREDLYMGWHELPDELKEDLDEGVLEMSPDTDKLTKVPVGNPVTIESGISRITLQTLDGLTIFSTGGNTIYHAEFKFNSGVNDLVIRNLRFDEIWEWEDWRASGYGSSGGRGDGTRNGWSFIKINGAKNVWLDHCEFGIAFDDNVGIENGSSGISITWCKFGDVDFSVGSMLYKTLEYMEMLYQKSKEDKSVKPFVLYSIMRDNNVSMEDIGKLMGYHSKCHMTGAGDKDSWLVKDADGNLVEDKTKTNANERLRLTLAYNSYINIGSRVPMIRSGVGHLYNCYTDNTLVCEIGRILDSDPLNTGKNLYKQAEEAGGRLHALSRGMDARNGASIAADTCVYKAVDLPIVGTAYHPNGSNISAGFQNYWKYNYALIVNSSTRRYEDTEDYIGSSWDNNGNNLFTGGAEYYKDAEEIIGNWSWGQEGESLSYAYQTFPLEDVETNMNRYCGAGVMELTPEEWLEVQYSDTFPLKTVDQTKEIPLTDIALSKSEATLYIEEEFLQLNVRMWPFNTTEKQDSLKWESSDEQVVKVNNAGLVVPVSYGAATITVTTRSGYQDSCQVRVTGLPKKLTIHNVPETVYEGDIIQLDVNVSPKEYKEIPVLWENGGIRMELLDSEKGIFKALAAGNNMVQVSSGIVGNRVGTEQARANKTIKIKKTKVYVTGVAVDEAVDVTVGEQKTLHASVVPEDATSRRLTYEVSDAGIATVDASGVVCGIATGETVVTITSVNGGYTKTCRIQVGMERNPMEATMEAVVPGDVDGNQKVDLKDVRCALRAAFLLDELTPWQKVAADVDKNQSIDLKDAGLILRRALLLIMDFVDF